MFEQPNTWRGSTAVRRPQAADAGDAPLIAELREAGEVVAQSSRDVRAAGANLIRGLVVLLVVPTVVLTLFSGAAWRKLGLVAAYVPFAFMAYIAWRDWLGKEWRGRQRRRRERLRDLEDVAALRAQAVREER